MDQLIGGCPSLGSKVRVAHVSGYIEASYGGVPAVILSLGREMAQLKQEVSVWTTGTAEDRVHTESCGFVVNTYERRWPKGWFRSPDLIRGLRDAIPHMDLLHLHGVWTYVQQATSRLANKSGIPYMITPHGVLEPWRIRYKGFKKGIYFSLVARRMLSASACLHAVTSREVDGFRRCGYDGPVTIIPNGVDIPNCDIPSFRAEANGRWPILKGRRVVLFLSRLSKEKGLDQFLPAFAQFAKQKTYDDMLLVLAGSGTEDFCKTIKALIGKLGIEEQVLLTGFVQGHDKHLLTARADVYVLPSYSEGLSVSLLENLAMGNPVLITTGCNLPEVVQAGAGVCCSATRDSLAEGLGRLLDTPQKERCEMGRRGRNLMMRDYAWDVIAKKFLCVYDCIIRGNPIPLYPEPIQSGGPYR